MRLVLSLVVVLVALILVGCGPSSATRCGVQGQVTLQGVPLDQGTISFYPAPAAKTMAAGALILNGKFEISAEQGLPPGKYRVEISSLQGVEITPEEYAAGKSPVDQPPKERIPAKYNTESQEVVELQLGDSNHFDFAIE